MDKTRLTVDNITPGMKLAEPILNGQGVTLMPAGIRLTPMFIARIRKWNIDAVDVFVDKARPDTAARRAAAKKNAELARKRAAMAEPAVISARQEEFARLTAAEISRPFVNVKTNPLMMQLRSAVIKELTAHGRHGIVNILRHPPGLEPQEASDAP